VRNSNANLTEPYRETNERKAWKKTTERGGVRVGTEVKKIDKGKGGVERG
jgi:hypothetical protein